MMNTSIDMKTALEAWRSTFSHPEKPDRDSADHILEERLYKMALDGGMERCDKQDRRHLSQCAQCLEIWAGMRNAITDLETADDYHPEEMMSFGMLEAAADEGPMEPVSLKSPCGKFTLGLFPQLDDSDRGMISLEVDSKTAERAEGKTAVVRDCRDQILLQGTIRQGRLARKIADLKTIDLSRWTVIVR